jgi:hypothetical protein
VCCTLRLLDVLNTGASCPAGYLSEHVVVQQCLCVHMQVLILGPLALLQCVMHTGGSLNGPLSRTVGLSCVHAGVDPLGP